MDGFNVKRMFLSDVWLVSHALKMLPLTKDFQLCLELSGSCMPGLRIVKCFISI